MEWLNLFFQGKESWMLVGGLLLVVLLQIMTLHKIKKAFNLLKQMEYSFKCESENSKVQDCVQQVAPEKERQLEIAEVAEEGQALEESPEQLIDAVLAEVFR